GELHDVALVHERHAPAPGGHRVPDGAVDEPLGAEPAHGLEADADFDTILPVWRANRLELRLPVADGALAAEANLLELFREFLFEKIEKLSGILRPRRVLNPCVDVLGV